jgi:hypothetical protein
MKPRWIHIFLRSSSVILLMAALDRFLILNNGSHILRLTDPIFEIQVKYGVIIVGAIELVVGLFCLFGRPVAFTVGCVAWLATNWAVCQLGLIWMNTELKGSCLGSLGDPFHLSHGAVRYIIKIVPLYLLFGSYATLIYFWLKGKNDQALEPVGVTLSENKAKSAVFARFLKISCNFCGGHIEFPTNLLGQQVRCPHCEAIIRLQKTAELKMSCLSCNGHVAFPAYAIGQIIPCPYCKTEITLKEPP